MGTFCRPNRRHAMALLAEKAAEPGLFVCMTSCIIIFHNFYGKSTTSRPHFADSSENNTRRPTPKLISWPHFVPTVYSNSACAQVCLFSGIGALKCFERLRILSDAAFRQIPPNGGLSCSTLCLWNNALKVNQGQRVMTDLETIAPFTYSALAL